MLRTRKMTLLDHIHAYRAHTFRTASGRRIRKINQAVEFVNERGFVFFWPISGITHPSLWAAVAGDRPVASEHDDPGHITWGWKDESLGTGRWYYAKVLRKKATMISLPVVPYFYALSENYGSYEDDYLTLYEQGRLTQEARAIYEALLAEGTLDTVALRRLTNMTSRDSDHRFNRAMLELQAGFMILPVGVTRSGAWKYAFAYDIVARRYPSIPDQAHSISQKEARLKLAEMYLRSVGAAQTNDIAKMFGWMPRQIEQTVEQLAQLGLVEPGISLDGQPGEWLVLRDLLSGA